MVHVLSLFIFGMGGFFFFKQKTAYEMRISDWSSDVCSSDLAGEASTIARAALRDAAINASLTAAEEPSKMIARAKRGGDTSLGEVVSDTALSAGVGAVGGAFFKGTEKAGRAILSRVRTPAGELSDKVRSTVGDKMTETTKAATNVLDR